MNQSPNNNSKPSREELQAKLREKIGMKTLQRRSTKSKLSTLNETQKNSDNSINIEELQEESHDLLMKEINSFSDNMGKLLSRNTDKFKEQLKLLLESGLFPDLQKFAKYFGITEEYKIEKKEDEFIKKIDDYMKN